MSKRCALAEISDMRLKLVMMSDGDNLSRWRSDRDAAELQQPVAIPNGRASMTTPIEIPILQCRFQISVDRMTDDTKPVQHGTPMG
jgi:hypothetical protein